MSGDEAHTVISMDTVCQAPKASTTHPADKTLLGTKMMLKVP